MKFLLDTHTFLWWIQDNEKLSDKASKTISKKGDDIVVSSCSIWELSIKIQLGKLTLKDPSFEFIKDQIQKNEFEILNINILHAWKIQQLPSHHKDPFDRMLIAQAQVEKIPIITQDQHFNYYDVEIIW